MRKETGTYARIVYSCVQKLLAVLSLPILNFYLFANKNVLNLTEPLCYSQYQKKTCKNNLKKIWKINFVPWLYIQIIHLFNQLCGFYF